MENDNRRALGIIQEYLATLLEKDLYEPIRQLFLEKGYDKAILFHDSQERGKDIVATKKGAHNILINVKKGNVNQRHWRTDVKPSLDQMMVTPINHVEIDELLPRRLLFVFNGELSIPLSQELDHFNSWYKSKGEPELEVWSIHELALEFNNFLLSINLIVNEYLEDLQRLILSITIDSIDKNQISFFTNKYLDLEQKRFTTFKLAVLYIKRSCEKKQNPYAFFYFMEYVLVKIWEKLYRLNDYTLVDRFDALHEMYMESMHRWVESIEPKEFSLWDGNSKESLELIFYPLRTFDAIRRISYLAYKYLLDNDIEKAQSCVARLIQIIMTNSSSGAPLCEFNYNDIGLALCVLYLTNHIIDARIWLFSLIDFLISLHSLGYSTVPLGGKISQVYELLFLQDIPKKQIKSHLLLLLFEFSAIFNAAELFEIFRFQLPVRISLYEMVMPNNESIIYGEDIIDAIETEIEPLEITISYFKLRQKERATQWEKTFSPIVHKRPFVLILLSNIHRDRYFPEVWRHILYNQTDPPQS